MPITKCFDLVESSKASRAAADSFKCLSEITAYGNTGSPSNNPQVKTFCRKGQIYKFVQTPRSKYVDVFSAKATVYHQDWYFLYP